MSEPHELTATEQLEALRSRAVSSRELTEHYLARIDKHDGELGAFVAVDPELALREADQADERLAREEFLPLGGLPLGVKDLHAVAGMPMSGGSVALHGHVPTTDEWTVSLLREAGAVFVGKTSASELGATCYVDGVDGRPAVTPYDLRHYSSGSSGGAASAVAAGLLPVAHGSDGAGSIRTPAATSNLVGVKPSRGLVNAAPTSFMAPASAGPLARTVEDAALLLDVMAKPLPGDIHAWLPARSFADTVRRGGHDSRGFPPLRVATWSVSGLEYVATHPDIVHAVHRTAALLRDLGHCVQEIDIPAEITMELVQAMRVWMMTSAALSASAALPESRLHLTTGFTRHLLQESQTISGMEVASSQARLAGYAQAFLTAFEEFDVALTPTTTAPPVPLGHFLEAGVENVAHRMLEWSSPTPWVNMTGQPAISLPGGFTSDALPIGIQLIGRTRSDVQLLALAHQVESAAPYHHMRPPLWTE